jgi:predicted enzyme related to lactoylglutathione lyase
MGRPVGRNLAVVQEAVEQAGGMITKSIFAYPGGRPAVSFHQPKWQ